MKSKKIAAMLAVLFLISGSSAAKASTINYSVKSGDNLWKLSEQYNTTVSSITSLNDMSQNDYLYIGQTLKINDNRGKHTVVSGDTLWKLSQKYNLSIDEIKSENNFTSDTLTLGQILIIPNHFEYTVVSGDTLWTISQEFSISISGIKELNTLTSDTLSIGQSLILPEASQNSENPESPSETLVETVNYRVATGDNLWSIAQKYGTTMDTIEQSNMLATTILMPGQILTIPVNSTEIVKPVGITMMKKRSNDKYGDLYDWDNARRIFTVGQHATLKDIETGKCFNIKYYGGSNHADIVTLTKDDTYNLENLFKYWDWYNKRPMVLYFTQGDTDYQLAVSVTGMPHGTTDIYDNGLDGHMDMYFYNSKGHKNPVIVESHQINVLKANGQ